MIIAANLRGLVRYRRCSQLLHFSDGSHSPDFQQTQTSAAKVADLIGAVLEPPTKTDFIQALKEQNLDYKLSMHSDDYVLPKMAVSFAETTKNSLDPAKNLYKVKTKYKKSHLFIQTECPECDSSDSNLISTVDGETNCSICGHEGPFSTYIRRISVRKSETTRGGGGDEQVKRKEEKRIEETLRRMESPDEFDSDLHDQVSYLNLMSQFKENQTTKKKERIMRARDDSDAPSPRGNLESGPVSNAPDPNIRYMWNGSVDVGELDGIEQSDVLQLRCALGIERISIETLSRYNVRAHMDNYDQPAILYPRYKTMASRLRAPAGLKVIRKVGDKLEKENYPLSDEVIGSQKFSGLFGYHMMSNSDRAVILTTNERDALAVYEAADGALALALPQGERLDPAVFPYLEEFEQIFIWFPSRHLDFAKDWGCALNGSRCYLVKSPDRPIELVRNRRNKDVKVMISQNAVRVRDKGFRSMTDIREEVKADILHSSQRLQGIALWKRFSPLNKYLQGFRPGELTVLTGGTGFGKTTFLCEYAMDLFTQGVRTLFCSFEMPEEKILKWMLIQYAGVPLHRVQYSSEIDKWLDKFERTKGPLTIMKSDEFHDKTITQIAQAIRNQVVNSGIQHVVIDNLQFLVNQTTLADDNSSGFDRFHHQDRFVGIMRQMATEYQTHITMVVHPRKTDSDTDLDIQHFGGSARVTQEADNVLAIQRRRDPKDKGRDGKKYLHILKNRYGGKRVDSDTLEMLFDSKTYSHSLIDHSRI